MVEQDERGQVHFEPCLGFWRRDSLLQFLEEPCTQRVEEVLDYDLIQLRVHVWRDRDLPVMRAVGIIDARKAECVASAHLPGDLDHAGDCPEIEHVYYQGVLGW